MVQKSVSGQAIVTPFPSMLQHKNRVIQIHLFPDLRGKKAEGVDEKKTLTFIAEIGGKGGGRRKIRKKMQDEEKLIRNILCLYT
ncbi:hypothetical protein TNCT_68861 [Trichonephila clavata]|uniref:Uncharacterized protein n=1 Tax=Trichonephila clavata TaxID=2740835 RepID=A0A8X6FU41_TRICU|nr:hypothetical protein TNCT_68861 [Trichonephila clavata]